MTGLRQELPVVGGLLARLVFTDRLVGGPGGSSRVPFQWGNLASHVGDDPAAVASNRQELAAELGLPDSAMTFMHPDHGRGVAVIGSQQPPTGVVPGEEIRNVDALVSRTPGVGLVALAADCVPVLLVEPQAAVVAAVHAGWRGVALNVARAAVRTVELLGGNAQRLRAYLGPAICPQCYPVTSERLAEVADAAPAAVSRTAQGRPALDLRAGIAAQLAQLGAAVELVGGCPAEDDRYFSYRRDGRTGRQAGAVALVGGRP
ncbi:MAG: polyphenol oxidase family protein [Candidatus Nanopelagicales bacterium]